MTEKSGQEQLKVTDFKGELLSGIRKRVATLIEQPWPDIQRVIEVNATDIINENSNHAINERDISFLVPVSSFLLATYRTLSEMIEDREQLIKVLTEAVGEAMGSDMKTYLYNRFRITQDAPGEAFEMVCENFKKIGEDQFGRSFVYEKEVQTESNCSFAVRKCFFDEFFRDKGVPELMPVCCVQDNFWMDELNKPEYGLTVTRSSLMSEGGDACRFHFTKRIKD